MKKILLAIIILMFFNASISNGSEKKSLTFETLMQLKRAGNPVFSPDGKTIAFTITKPDFAENSFTSNIWLMDANGKNLRQLTTAKVKDISPQWSPDGRTIAFCSDRSGHDQIWLIDTGGGEAKQLTDICTGASNPIWSPDGNLIAFTSVVNYKCKDEESQKRKQEEEKKNKVKAKAYDSLLYRHWDHFRNDKRSHLFVISTDFKGIPKDLTSESQFDAPPIALGGKRDYAFSPDSKEICYTTNISPVLTLSTNNDIFTIPANGGTSKKITENPANDNQPLYSPDGKFIAYRAQKIPGYESDRYRLILYNRNTKKIENLTENFDRTVEEVFWSPDSNLLYFTAPDMGFMSLYRMDAAGKKIEKLIDKSWNYSFSISKNRKKLLFVKESSKMPAEIRLSDNNGKNQIQISNLNKNVIDAVTPLNPAEEFTFTGAQGSKVHGFIIKPPQFNSSKKYPVIFLIHGGPQQMWGDTFGVSWNPQWFTSLGFVVVKINPRGSEGYGQKFTDEINKDWGGKPYIDLMNGVDYVTSHYPFTDKNRMVAMGASYGGYMVNWIAGHTDRFKCLVSIAGCYNLTAKYGSTDELWFPEWEMGGTPWTSKEQYEKWSPHNYAQNFKTPTLVISGQLDYRVPVTEGMQMFTSLQRLNVPSRFLYFPDEGHWISRPQNMKFYFDEIEKWLRQWIN